MKITVMSFNLRYDKPAPCERQWENRVEAIASLIKYFVLIIKNIVTGLVVGFQYLGRMNFFEFTK